MTPIYHSLVKLLLSANAFLDLHLEQIDVKLDNHHLFSLHGKLDEKFTHNLQKVS